MAEAKPAKKDVKVSSAASGKPMALSKFKKQRHAGAAKKSRTTQARHLRKSASKASSQAIADTAAAEQAAPKDTANTLPKSTLPPEVANARAQALADDQARNIAALDNANVSSVNGVLVAAADLPADAAPAQGDASAEPAPASAPVAAPPPPVPSGKVIRAMPTSERQVVKADDSDTWNKTSLIGKIFIAFGSLLTLASAARLLIA